MYFLTFFIFYINILFFIFYINILFINSVCDASLYAILHRNVNYIGP